jgi:UDP-N-acetylmuramoyl-tripeptide--D-alanyl-D-alanine ligase
VAEQSDLRLTGAWVADATRGSIVAGEAGRSFDGVSIDSRTVRAGELFVAISGDRFDGIAFAPAAIEAGAAGVVVPRGQGRALGGHEAAVVIEVDDTVVALQALAHRVRRVSGARVVAITGSAGKTTTKEVTAEFLAARYHVIRNRGNFNNHIGLPLSLIELRRRPEIAVVELGMNHAGEISTLVRMAEPDVRVWTNVGDAHLGFFGSVDAIAEAKAEILEGAVSSSLLVANADDDRIGARTSSFAGRVMTFGIDRAATIRARDVEDRGVGGMAAQVETPMGEVAITTPLIGRANLANVLAGMAVAVAFDVPLDQMAARAAGLRAAAHRGEVVRLSDITVIDDSYNANPTATRKALDVLMGERTAVRRIAVLGEMLELGQGATALHEEVGRAVARAHVDVLVAVGGEAAAALAGAARAAGMSKEGVHHFASSEEAAEATAALVRRGDLVLVKGSRGVRTDRIVERLKAERG